jgi:hypothetical protein
MSDKTQLVVLLKNALNNNDPMLAYCLLNEETRKDVLFKASDVYKYYHGVIMDAYKFREIRLYTTALAA